MLNFTPREKRLKVPTQYPSSPYPLRNSPFSSPSPPTHPQSQKKGNSVPYPLEITFKGSL